MSKIGKFDQALNSPLSAGFRSIIALLLAPLIFMMGMQKFKQNSFFTPIWERDYSNIWHALTGFGHTNTLGAELPTGFVGLASALIVAFMVLKGLANFPQKINLHLLGLLILDYLVISVLINIFIFSGTGASAVYYAGSFAAGIYLFGDRVTSQIAILGLVFLIIIRLIYVDGMYPYVFWIPILIVVYMVIRAPINSEQYREELKAFSVNKLIGRG